MKPVAGPAFLHTIVIMKKIPFLFAVLLLLAGCKSTPEKTVQADIPGIDSSTKAVNNFFMYVNRTWYDSAQIPPSQSGVGAYMFMNYPQRLRLQGILDSVSKATNPAGSIEQKLGDFYASGMDTATVNQRGYEPLKPLLGRIDSISDLISLMKFVAVEASSNNTSILAFGVGPDNKNSKLNIAHIYQSGIGLPERDYYFKTDGPSMAIQQAYKLYLAKLFQLTGNDTATAAKNAGIVYNIDKQLAASHRTNIELRDVHANYNKMAVATLIRQQPNIGWQQVLDNLGAKNRFYRCRTTCLLRKIECSAKINPHRRLENLPEGQYAQQLCRCAEPTFCRCLICVQ